MHWLLLFLFVEGLLIFVGGPIATVIVTIVIVVSICIYVGKKST